MNLPAIGHSYVLTRCASEGSGGLPMTLRWRFGLVSRLSTIPQMRLFRDRFAANQVFKRLPGRIKCDLPSAISTSGANGLEL